MTPLSPERMQDLRDELAAEAVDVVSALFGSGPSSSGPDGKRWRGKGSFLLRPNGSWSDFEDGGGRGTGFGDMLGLIRRELGGTFGGAVQWARTHLGWPEDDAQPEQDSVAAIIERMGQAKRRADRAEARKREEEERQLRQQRQADTAAALWERSIPIGGTLAERYLVETRGIPAPVAGWPGSAARFDPVASALVFRIVDETGATAAVQSTHLSAEAQKTPDAGGLQKRTRGSIGGRSAVLPAFTPGDALLVGEGGETVMTAWAATGHEGHVTLGSVARFAPPPGRTIVVLRENDAADAGSRKAIEAAIARWRTDGLDVRECWAWSDGAERPAMPSGKPAKDLNDLAQLEGVEAVRARVAGALAGERQRTRLIADTADEAAAALAGPMDAFWSAAEADSAARLRFVLGEGLADAAGAQHLIRVGLGIGKTELALRTALSFVDGAYFDPRHPRPDGVARRVCLVPPTHQLARDIVRRLNEMRPGSAQVWHGIEADHPTLPNTKACLRVHDYAEIKKAGGGIDDLCGRGKVVCPHHSKSDEDAPRCLYRAQQDSGAPIVVLCGATSLANGVPATFKRKAKRNGVDVAVPPFDVLIVDETKPADFLGGFGPHAYSVDVGMLASKLYNPPGQKERLDQLDLEAVQDVLGALRRLLAGTTPEGGRAPLTVRQLRSIMAHCRPGERQAAAWTNFRDCVYKLKRDLPDVSGVRGEALQVALRDVHGWNRRIMALARLAYAIRQSLDDNESEPDNTLAGQVEVHTSGESAKFILGWRERLSKDFASLPALILDGTADEELLRPWFPRLTLAADIDARMPEHVEVVQVSDSFVGYQDWTPGGETATNNLERLARLLEVQGARYGEAVAIVPLKTEEWLRGHWGEGAPVGLAHFNDVRGRDEFKNVRCLTSWSRPQALPAEFERQRAVLVGRWGERLTSHWYDRQPAGHLMRDGSIVRGKADRHPDEITERLRRQGCEAELLQAVGRARGVRRTAETPLTIVIGTRTPLPLPVDRLVTKKDLLADATYVDAVMASGLIPKPGYGSFALLAAATGKTSEQVADFCRTNPAVAERLEKIGRNPENAFREFPKGDFRVSGYFSEWRIQTSPKGRLAGLFLTDVAPGDRDAALAKLATFGIAPAELEAVIPQEKRSRGRPRKAPPVAVAGADAVVKSEPSHLALPAEPAHIGAHPGVVDLAVERERRRRLLVEMEVPFRCCDLGDFRFTMEVDHDLPDMTAVIAGMGVLRAKRVQAPRTNWGWLRHWWPARPPGYFDDDPGGTFPGDLPSRLPPVGVDPVRDIVLTELPDPGPAPVVFAPPPRIAFLQPLPERPARPPVLLPPPPAEWAVRYWRPRDPTVDAESVLAGLDDPLPALPAQESVA